MSKQVSREQAIRAEANAMAAKKSNGQQFETWRGDPAETFSDWTIQVVVPEREAIQSYHVNKYVLGYGPRKGDYFERMFKQADCKEQTSKSSQLMLNPLAASAFPVLLDFAYQCTKELAIDTQSATALLSLANYLGMDQVRQIAETFIRKDLAIVTMNTYWEHSKFFPEVNDILADFLVRHHLEFPRDDPFIRNVDIAIWEKVASMIAQKTEKEALSKRFSRLFSVFGAAQTISLEADTFRTILSEHSAPIIHPDAALPIAELCAQLFPEEHGHAVSSLLDRCAHALPQSEWFQTVISKGSQRIYERLGKLPGYFVSSLWKQRTEQSSREEERMKRKRRAMKAQLQKYSYEEILQKSREQDLKQREELNGVIVTLRATSSSPLSLQEIRVSPQYQSLKERYTVETGVFEELLDLKCSEMGKAQKESQDAVEPMQRPTRGSKKLSMENPARAAVSEKNQKEDENLYAVGRKFFVRDANDGFGGFEYPTSIIEPVGVLKAGYRRITWEGYDSRWDRDVRVSELLDWTQERQDYFSKECLPVIKRNDERQEELRRNRGYTDAKGQDAVETYEKGALYYLRENDGIDYPVRIIRFCRAKHRCEVKFVGYGKRVVDLCSLLPHTPERQAKFGEHEAFTKQKKQQQADEEKLRKMSKATQRGAKRKRSSPCQEAKDDADLNVGEPRLKVERGEQKGEISSDLLAQLDAPQPMIGRWSLNQELLFHWGLKKHGWGKWKEICVYVPNRTAKQVGNYGHKALLRQEGGENILQDHQQLLKLLLARYSPAEESISEGSEMVQAVEEDEVVEVEEEEVDEKMGTKSSGELHDAQPMSGRWSLDQELLFRWALQKHGGKGKWKRGKWQAISDYVPNRTAIQVKSHAQKLLLEQEAGEDIFQILQDQKQRVQLLLTGALTAEESTVAAAKEDKVVEMEDEKDGDKDSPSDLMEAKPASKPQSTRSQRRQQEQTDDADVEPFHQLTTNDRATTVEYANGYPYSVPNVKPEDHPSISAVEVDEAEKDQTVQAAQQDPDEAEDPKKPRAPRRRRRPRPSAADKDFVSFTLTVNDNERSGKNTDEKTIEPSIKKITSGIAWGHEFYE